MKVSIIILTLNGEKTIEDCLKAVFKQKLDGDFEVIVVDSGSTDKTQMIVANYPVVYKEIESHEFGHGKTRNFAVNLARGEFVVFLSQDAIPADDSWLPSLLQPFTQDAGVGAVYSRQLAPISTDPVNKFRMQWLYGDQLIVKKMDGDRKFPRDMIAFSNVGSAIPRHLLEKHRFREEMELGEDNDCAYQLLLAGHKIIYEPRAKVWHVHKYTLRYAFQYYFDVTVAYKKSGILDRMESVEGEGSKYVWEELKYLCKGKYFAWIPYALVCNLAQYAGFRIGYIENLIPKSIKKRVSYYWY